MKVEPFLIVSTVNVIIGQRLIRKLSNKEQYFLTEAEFDQLSKNVDVEQVMRFLKQEKVVDPSATWKKIPFYKAVKTSELDDGFKGRVGIHEVLKVSSTIRELIMQGKTAKDIEEQAKKEGMLTMLEDGIFLAVQGLTTIEEVFRVISE
jgi:type II secretory ATPase GspE/PulE/Tfp pilus assembly ATPase PilB-like protein